MSELKPKKSLQMLELIFWLTIAYTIAWRPIYYIIMGWSYFMDYYTSLLLGIVVILVPFLFKLIYGFFPLEYARRLRQKRIDEELKRTSGKNITETKLPHIPKEDAKIDLEDEESFLEEDGSGILMRYVWDSESLAEKIYNRSGVYLLIGCLIAFAGVLFFYFQSTNLHLKTSSELKPIDFSNTLLEYLPRLGTLIFVEAIAFFFLRQYRRTMEEFRYYEALKRQRENQQVIFKLVKDYKDNPELFDKLIGYCSFNSNPNKMVQGETNNILEAEKLMPKDKEWLDQLIELVKVSKR